MSKYPYDAFISYRHRPVDMAVAKRLVELLERVNGADGEKLRIFRDRDELPAEENLGEAIRNGLKGSEYLIVVCSPSYSESKWCMEELRFFRSLHGNANARVIPILVEGEPEDAFPEALRWEERVRVEEDGTVHTFREEVEPLSADVRADSHFRRMWLLRTEYLRILARILKKPFDELYNRARRRRIRTVSALALLVISGLIAFASYNMNMLSRIEQEHMDMLANESLRLSVASEESLARGDTQKAMLLALEALPEDPADPERPLIPEAETALRSAVYTQLHARQAGELERIATVRPESQDWQLRRIFDHGRKFSVEDQEWLSIYDAANGMCLFRYPSDFYSPAELNGDGTLVARSILEGDAQGLRLYRCEVYSVAENALLFSEILTTEKYSIYPVWDLENNLCLFFDDETVLLTVDGSGVPDRDPQLSPEYAAAVSDAYFDLDSNISDNYADFISGNPSKNGPQTSLGEAYREKIEGIGEDGSYCAYITPDERYLILCGSRVRVFDMTRDMEQLIFLSLEGSFVVDSENLRFYSTTADAIYVYALHPQNKASYGVDLLSLDGSRGLRYRFSNSSGEDEQLWIYAASDLDTPLLDLPVKNHGPYAQYYLTPNLDYAFVRTPEDSFQLWHVERGLVLELEIPPEAAAQRSTLSVSADGSLLAVAWKESKRAAVYSGLDGRQLLSIDLSRLGEEEDFDYNRSYYLEFEGTDLLISLSSESWVVDTAGNKSTLEIPDGISGGPGMYRVDGALTGDGLLLCMGEWFDGAVDAIYDIRTGECVFRTVSYVQYHQPSGTLLYIPAAPAYGSSSSAHAARRDASGRFKDVYSVPMGEGWGTWPSYECLSDSLFLLQGRDTCSLYEIAAGTHRMTLRLEGYDPYYSAATQLIGDKIYDLAVSKDGGLYTLPVLDTAALMERAKEFLSSPLGIRQLTDTEKAEYFIE